MIDDTIGGTLLSAADLDVVTTAGKSLEFAVLTGSAFQPAFSFVVLYGFTAGVGITPRSARVDMARFEAANITATTVHVGTVTVTVAGRDGM